MTNPSTPPTDPRVPATGLGALRHVATLSTVWQNFIALGDSFTEGMSDDENVTVGQYSGWADRLATMLAAEAERSSAAQSAAFDEATLAQAAPAGGAATPPFRYANLAIRGRLLADVAGPQTTLATEHLSRAEGPTLVSIVGGGNDILRPRADIDSLAAQLDHAVAQLRGAGADVLMATPTDPSGAPLISATRGRAATYIAHIWSIAGRHGCYVLNQWDLRFLQDWRMWAPDRIHMTPEGHRRVALAAYAALGHTEADEGAFRHPLDPATMPVPTWREHRNWLRQHAGPWARRRVTRKSSGDRRQSKLPELTPWPLAAER